MLQQTAMSSLPFSAEVIDGLSFSPAFVLASSFGACIREDQKFMAACKCGFDCYIEGLYETDENWNEVFHGRPYTWDEVVALLVETVDSEQDIRVAWTRSWCAGFALGWLSALALTDRAMAEMGLIVLYALMGHLVAQGC